MILLVVTIQPVNLDRSGVSCLIVGLVANDAGRGAVLFTRPDRQRIAVGLQADRFSETVATAIEDIFPTIGTAGF